MEHIIESKWVPMQVSLNGLLLDILTYEGSNPDKLRLTVNAIGTNMTIPVITRAFSNKYCDVFRKRYMKNFATKSVIIKGQTREFPSFISTDSTASRCYGNPRDLYIFCRAMWNNVYAYFTKARWSKPKDFNCDAKYGKYTRAILLIISKYVLEDKDIHSGRSVEGFLKNCSGVLPAGDSGISANFIKEANAAKVFDIKDQSTRNRRAMNMFSMHVTKADYTDGPFDPAEVWFKYMGLEDPKDLYNWIRDFGNKIFIVNPYVGRSVFSRGYHTVSKDYINKLKNVEWIESKLGIAGISDLHTTLNKLLSNTGYFRASAKIKHKLDPEDVVDPYTRFDALKALAEYVIKTNKDVNPIKTAIAASDVKKAVGGKVTLTEAEYNKLRKSCPDRSRWISPSEYKKKIQELGSSGVDMSKWMSIKKHKDLMSKCTSKKIDTSKWISPSEYKKKIQELGSSGVDMSKWMPIKKHKDLMSKWISPSEYKKKIQELGSSGVDTSKWMPIKKHNDLMSKCSSKKIDMSKWISRQEHTNLMSKRKSLQDQTRDWIFTKKKAMRLNPSTGNYSEPTEVYMPSVLINGICRPIVVGSRGSVYIQRNGWRQYTTPDVFNKKWCSRVYMK